MADIRNLLRIDQVAPASVSANPVEFTSAEFYGGQTDVAKAPTYVGRGNEELQYMALAEIAGGVQQGLNNFSSIAQTLDRRTISKVESQWEEIDANDTLSPDEKISEFNKILNKTETPFSGNEWKSQFTRRVVKSWGADFSNEVAQNSFNKWVMSNSDKYGDIMGPQLIQEAMDEFIKENPALAGVPWVEGIFTQAQATFVEMESQRALNQAVISQAADYTLTPDKQKALVDGEIGADNLKETDPIYAETLNMATGAKSFAEFKEAFDKKWGEDLTFIGLRIEDEKVQGDFIVKSTGIRDASAKDIWDLSRRMKTEDRLRRASSAYDIASLNFRANPTPENLESTTTSLKQVLADQNETQQLNTITKYATDILYGLETGRLNGDLNFSQLPPAEKIRILEEELDKVFKTRNATDILNDLETGKLSQLPIEEQIRILEGGLNNGFRSLPLKGSLKGLKTKDIVSFVRETKEGQSISSSVMDASVRVSESLRRSIEISTVMGNQPPSLEDTTSKFVQQFSVQTGLPISTVEQLFVTKDKDGFVTLRTEMPADIIRNLSPEDKKLLDSVGLTPENLIKIQDDFVKTLSESGIKSSRGATGTGSSKLGVNIPGETAAKQAIIKDPSIVQKALDVFNDPFATPEARREAGIIYDVAARFETTFGLAAEQALLLTAQSKRLLSTEETDAYSALSSGRATTEQIRLIEANQVLTKVDDAYKTLYGKSKDELKYFDLLEPVDAALIDQTNWVDNAGIITPDGRRIGLKLRIQAETIASDLGYAGRDEYLADYKRRLEALSTESIDDLTPSNFFAVLEMTRGFKNSKQTIGVFNDQPVMQNFMEFVASQEIPPTANISKYNTIYATALDVSLAAVTGSGSVDVRYSVGTTAGERVNTYTRALQAGNTSPLGSDEEFGTYVTIAMAKEIGVPAASIVGSPEVVAQSSLEQIHGLLKPLLPNGIPLPGDTENKTVVTTVSSTQEKSLGGGTRMVSTETLLPWNKLTPDQKLQYYFNEALKGNPETVKSLMKLPIILNGVMDRAELIGTPEERFSGVKELFRSGIKYSEVSGASIPKFSPTFTFTNGRVSSSFITGNPGSNTQISYQTRLPNIPRLPSELQPETMRQKAVEAMSGDAQIPNFDDIENKFDSWIGTDSPVDRPDIADVIEADAELLREIVDKDPSERRGIEVGLDPTDQVIVGLMSLPATESNIKYVSDMFGLNLTTNPNLRLDSTSVLEHLSSTGQGVELLKILKDANIGAGSQNKVKFDVAFDTKKPVLLIKRGNNLVPYGIPGAFPNVDTNAPANNEISRNVRFTRTFKIIRDLQQGVR